MGVTSNFRSAATEPLSHALEVQNAYYKTGRVSDQIRGLVRHDRSKRRLFPDIHPSQSQEVPEEVHLFPRPGKHAWLKSCQRTSVFSLDEWDVGLAKNVEHQIRLSDSKSFRERSRRIVPADIDDVRRHLQELLAAGIIKESRSPYASPIVIVRKKNGCVRMCIDYRILNSRTIPALTLRRSGRYWTGRNLPTSSLYDPFYIISLIVLIMTITSLLLLASLLPNLIFTGESDQTINNTIL